MRKTYFFSAFLFLHCFIVNLYSQTGLLFSTDNHLSNSLINCVYQDSRNYIWIATEDGLNKYDAVKFTVYKNVKGDSTTLKNNYVRTLFEDSKGRFFIGCINGLLLYNRSSDTFKEIKLYKDGKLIEPEINSIIEDNKGDIWVGASQYGVIRIRDEREGYEVDTKFSKSLNSLSLVKIFQSSDGNYWFLTDDQGLSLFSPSRNRFYRFKSPVHIGSNQTSAICETKNGQIFVGTLTSGLFKFNRHTWCFDPVETDKVNETLPIKCLFVNAQKQLLVGTDGMGMKVYNEQTNRLESSELRSASFDFSKMKVHSILQDRDGNIWTGMFQKGVYFTPNNSNKFIIWGYKSVSRNIIGSSCVMSVLKDREGILWVGTDNDGIYGVDERNQVRHFTRNSANSVSRTIMCIFEDSNGDMWLGSYLNGLSKFNKQTGVCSYFNQIPEAIGNNFLSNKVICIAEDGNKNLWFGTNGAGVYALNLNTLKFTKHYAREGGVSGSLVYDGVTCLLHDSDGMMWVGTFRGLTRINPTTNKIDHFTTANNILPGTIVYFLFEGHDNKIWIGTNEGLACLDKSTGKTKHYTKNDGLPSNVICGIDEDADGNLWVSTHFGIAKFVVDEKKFINYYASDGLQGNEFTRGACFKANSGELFFGGIGGVTSFFPNQITNNRKKLEVHLTGLNVLDVPISTDQKSGRFTVLDRFIGDADKINLGYDDNMFSLEFSTFNYGSADRIYYRYKLDGLNSQWVNTAVGNNRISFTNLNYGVYKLRIVACENDNESAEKQIEIIINPPWYLTPVAKFLYFLLLVGLAYVVTKVVNERIQHRHELIRREHLEQINEGKLQFFINISHEIRTPMTLILSPLEKLMQDASNAERTQAYQLMYRNAQRILRLINQLLDLRKIDKKLMFVKMREVDIVSFVQDVVKTFEYQSNKKKISLDFEYESPGLNAWIDVNNFDKVLVNILSNAFKFTPEQGEIKIQLTTGYDEDADELKEYFQISVLDNGIGIQEDKIEKIFERFYQIDTSQANVNFGTGIGLHLSRNLVELMHGVIFARNREDIPGSEFIIRLPLGSSHLQDAEIELVDEKPVLYTANQYEYIPELESTTEKVKPKTRFRILLVDDEAEIRHYLKQNLADTYKLSEAENGKIALEMLLKEKFDLVVSDVMMPEMDGFTLCKKLKSNVNISHIPILLLTAKTSDEDKAEGYETGADAYVSKPFNIDLLKKRISGLIENRVRLEPKIANKDENKALIKQVELKSADQLLLERLLKHLNENIGNADFNAQMLADKVGLSRVHLHRKMKALTNQSAADYIRTFRLKQAAVLLTSKKLTVSEVCYALGFTNQTHFSVVFKEFYGMSPKEYIRHHAIENSD